MDEVSKEAFYKGMYEGIYKALCRNYLTAEVAHFIANLAVDVEKLKRNEL